MALFLNRMFDDDLMLFPRSFYNNYLSEVDGGYVLEVPIPGMTSENVKLQLDDNSIYITAESDKRHKHSQLASKYSYAQRLPRDINPDSIEATVEHGVLTIHVQKLERKKNVKEIKVR